MTDAPATLTADDYKNWAEDLRDGPVALTLRQKLLPVEGEGGIIFPATYADTPGGYNIDTLSDGTKVAQVDSVGAQANRIEPLFKEGGPGGPEIAALVPQIRIRLPDENTPPVSIMDAGHRLGDAIIRMTELAREAKTAFEEVERSGDATSIAKLAPTSLVFGAWDSRGTQAKLPRIVSSVIRAWDIDPLKRSAQYNPAIDYEKAGAITPDDRQKAEGNPKSEAAQRGFVHVPAPGSHGGIFVRGDIRREVTINLVALRRLGPEQGTFLRAYVLGLALVSATQPLDGFLRQGCLLTPDPDAESNWIEVSRDGRRRAIKLNPALALSFATKAAEAFGVGKPRTVTFNPALARDDMNESKKGKGKGGAAGSAG